MVLMLSSFVAKALVARWLGHLRLGAARIGAELADVVPRRCSSAGRGDLIAFRAQQRNREANRAGASGAVVARRLPWLRHDRNL
jgi:hypothetical protein